MGMLVYLITHLAALFLNTLMYQLVDTPLAGMGYVWVYVKYTRPFRS